MQKIPIAILGATGLVGQQFVRMLTNHPFFEIALLTGSSRSAGRPFGEAADWVMHEPLNLDIATQTVQPLSVNILLKSGVHAVFSALPSSEANEMELTLRSSGFLVFTNTSCHRMDPDVPILIPEINRSHLELVNRQQQRWKGAIIANANCSSTGLSMVLKALESLSIRHVFVSTYQALSGAGRRGLASFDTTGNVIPLIRNEEEKMCVEIPKILGKITPDGLQDAPLSIVPHCARVPVRDGHLESVTLGTGHTADVKDVVQMLRTFHGEWDDLTLPTAPADPIVVHTSPDRPQPILDYLAGSPPRTAGMAVSVGRVRKVGPWLQLFLLVHNTIRGAAGTCVLNAELAYVKGLLKP